VADEARPTSTKLDGEYDNMAKCLHASKKNASQAKDEADKLNGEHDKLKGVYENMVKRLDAFKKAAVHATKDATHAKRAHALI
jgi:predicted nuclease with TOPRIM domain